jgi:uncharacterized protein YdaU (DUF1376 family)
MPLYVADYLADTLDLRTDETGVYLLMLMIAWRRPDGALPNDMKWLQRALSSCASDMHGNRFNRLVPPLLSRFFILGEDGKFRNKRLTKEREKAEKFSEKQKETAGKRWCKDNKNNDVADANAMPARASQSQPQSQSQKEEEQETRANALVVDDGWPADYRDQFWSRYPNKVGKPKALAKLDACRKRRVPFDAIMAGLDRYMRTKPPDRQWLNPETFINQERWTDQPAPISQGSHNGRRTVHDAARDLHENLLERMAAFDEPAPRSLCDGTGENAVRLLPPRRCE